MASVQDLDKRSASRGASYAILYSKLGLGNIIILAIYLTLNILWYFFLFTTMMLNVCITTIKKSFAALVEPKNPCNWSNQPTWLTTPSKSCLT